MSFYRRRLPHWQPEGVPVFLTWRLHSSLPGWHQAATSAASDGQRFIELDRQLDAAASGPMFLKDPRVAAAVVQALFIAAHEWKLFDLMAWVLMSNHVHVLLQPHKPLREVTRAVKSTSARAANLILGRTGQPFWQDESYDHWVRDGKELQRIVQYIEWNPVRAGLIDTPELWPWSSASKGIAGQVGDLPHMRIQHHL